MERSNLEDLGAVGPDPLDSPRMVPNINNRESEDSYQEEWSDVWEFGNLSLEETKPYPIYDDEEERYEPLTKVVVRRLPPHFTVEDYLRKLPLVPSYNYVRRATPSDDLPSSIDGRNSIFINFDTEHEAFWFKENYNNMEFFDEQGKSCIASIDYAFVQGVSKNPPAEPEMGILEETEMYRRFLKVYKGDPRDPRTFTIRRPDEISIPETMADEPKNRIPAIGYPVNNSSPLSDFLREQSKKKAEQERKIREKEELRRQQKEEMLKRRQEEEEEATRINKPNHSKPIFPALWLENKAFRQDFEMIKAEVKRSQERLNPTKCLKKSTDKLTNKTRANNNTSSCKNSTNVLKPFWLPSLPEEDSDQSSSSSDDTVIDVHISNRPKRQQSSFEGSQKLASSDSGRNSNQEEEGSDK